MLVLFRQEKAGSIPATGFDLGMSLNYLHNIALFPMSKSFNPFTPDLFVGFCVGLGLVAAIPLSVLTFYGYYGLVSELGVVELISKN